MAYRTPIPKDDSEMKGVIYGSVESMGGLHSSAPVGKSSDDSDSFETGTNFDKVFHGPTSYEGINVTFYKSRETGLKVMVADAQIPIVHGYLTVPTEILDDTGCPHTLEHLIFLGSEKYRYKGLLDRLANRAFANGTNAWTDTDVTVYTISTVGQEGFLRFIPIYVDHILYASLTQSGYVTEVHHVNGEGKDAGVVYSEMQARENTPGDLMALINQRAMYPEGVGYRSETGGLMEALRQLDIETIRRYHGNYYLPQNLTLVIVGNINHRDLLQTLQTEVESSILAVGKPDLANWKRPWVTSHPAPPLHRSRHVEVVEFPAKDEEDEEVGEFMVSCFGPSANDVETQYALEALGDYLTDSPVSVLQHNFTEIEDPIAGDVHFSVTLRVPCTLTIEFESVPVEHLATPEDPEELQSLESELFEVLDQIAQEGINMERMTTVINNLRSRSLYSVEQNPSNHFSHKLICEALYGDLTGNTLKDEIMSLRHYDTLLQWTSEQWVGLLRTWLLENPRVVVLGIPSSKRANELKETEERRVSDRHKKLGEKGLKELERKVEEAQKENNAPIPDEVIEGFKIPRIENVQFIDTVTAVYRPSSDHSQIERNKVEQYLDQHSSDHPYNLVFSHTSSAFVSIVLYITTKDIPGQLLPYLECYTDLFFSLPVMRNGKIVEYEKVVEELNAIATDHFAKVSHYRLRELVAIGMTVEKKNYEKAVALLSEIFVNSVFDQERISNQVSKSQNDIPSAKRDGYDMTAEVMYCVQLDDTTSVKRATTTLRQEPFLGEIETSLEKDSKTVIENFEALRAELIKLERLRINVIADVYALDNPTSVWENFVPYEKIRPLLPLTFDRNVFSEEGLNPSGKAYIVSLATQETTYLRATTKGVESLLHPDVAAIELTIAWLEATEGHLWTRIRGAGLAYGAFMSSAPRRGEITLDIYRSPNAFHAWKEAQKIIKEVLDGQIEIKQSELDSAKSTYVYSITSSVATKSRAGTEAYIDYLEGLPKDFKKMFLKKVTEDVSTKDVRRIIETYLVKLFDPKTSDLSCISAPTTVESISASFKEEGFETVLKELEDFA